VEYDDSRPFQGDLYEFDRFITRVFELVILPVNDPPVKNVEKGVIFMTEDVPMTFINYHEWITDIDSELEWNVTTGKKVKVYFLKGVLNLEPYPDEWGVDTVYITATDGEYYCTIPLEIHIEGVNDAVRISQPLPLVVGYEDTGPYLSINLSHYFYDVDGDLIHYSIDTLNSGIIYSLDNDILTVDSMKDWFGDCTIAVFASDGQEITYAPLNVVIYPVNDPPVIKQMLTLELLEDVRSEKMQLNDYFYDVDSELVYSIEPGLLLIDRSGDDFWVKGDRDRNGDFEFTITASDGEYSVSMVVFVKIAPVNDPPVALYNEVILTIYENMTVDTVDLNELFFDVDSVLTFEISTDIGDFPAHIRGYNMTVDIAKNTGGLNWFVVTATDGEYWCEIRFVIDFRHTNSKPVVRIPYSEMEIFEDEYAMIELSDYIVDWDSTLFWYVDTDIGIDHHFIDNGKMMIAPVKDFYGNINVTLMAHDGEYEARCEILLKVIGVNDPPVAIRGLTYLYIDEDTDLIYDISPLFFDVDSSLVFSTDHGRIINGVLEYTPPHNWNGRLLISVEAYDGEFTATTCIELMVNPVRDDPIPIGPSEMEMSEDGVLVIPLDDLFYDVDGQAVYTLMENECVSGTIEGRLLTLRPSEYWHGITSVVIQWEDEVKGEYEFLLRVNPVNRPPIGYDGEYSMDEDEVLHIDIDDIFANTGNDLKFNVATIIGQGYATVTEGIIMVTPEENWHGAMELLVTADDGEFVSQCSIFVNVLPVYDPITVKEGTLFVLLEDDDPVILAFSDLLDNPDGSEIQYWYTTRDLKLRQEEQGFVLSKSEEFRGKETFTLYASDGTTTVSKTVVVSDGIMVQESSTSGWVILFEMKNIITLFGIALVIVAVMSVTVLAQHAIKKRASRLD